MVARDRMPAEIYEGFRNRDNKRVKSPFEERYDVLIKKKRTKDKEFASGGAMNSLLRNSKGQFKNYVESSGRNVGFADTQKRLDNAINEYDENILFPLVALRKEIINSVDINSKMNELTKINNRLKTKRKNLNEAKDNYTTAQVRDKALTTRNQALSFQQTWGIMQRPIKKQTVPVLIVFSLLFIYIGVLGIYYISPVSAIVTTAAQGAISIGGEGVLGNITGFLSQNPVLAALIKSSAVIGIILIILKAFGKI